MINLISFKKWGIDFVQSILVGFILIHPITSYSNESKTNVVKINIYKNRILDAETIINIIKTATKNGPIDPIAQIQLNNLKVLETFNQLSPNEYNSLIQLILQLSDQLDQLDRMGKAQKRRVKQIFIGHMILESLLIEAAREGWLQESVIINLLGHKTHHSIDLAFKLSFSTLDPEGEVSREILPPLILEYIESGDRSLEYSDSESAEEYEEEKDRYYESVSKLLLMLNYEEFSIDLVFQQLLKKWILKNENEWELRYSIVMAASPDLIEPLGNDFPFIGKKGPIFFADWKRDTLLNYLDGERQISQFENGHSINYVSEYFIIQLESKMLLMIFGSSQNRFDALMDDYVRKMKSATKFPVDIKQEMEIRAMLKVLAHIGYQSMPHYRFEIFNPKRIDSLRAWMEESKRLLSTQKMNKVVRYWKLHRRDVSSLLQMSLQSVDKINPAKSNENNNIDNEGLPNHKRPSICVGIF